MLPKDLWLLWEPEPKEQTTLEEGHFFVPANATQTVAMNDTDFKTSRGREFLSKLFTKSLLLIGGISMLILTAACVYVIIGICML